MKKIIAIFTAALTLVLCGCSDSKNTDSELPPVESVPVETSEEPSEQGMRLYTDADFTDVTVKVSKTGGTIPVESKEYDVSDMIFEEKLSPCKSDGVREKIYEKYVEVYGDGIYNEDYVRTEIEMYSGPERGRVMSAVALGMGVIYVVVTYDNHCPTYGHSFEIWTYSLSDGSMERKYVYESTDRAVNINEMRYVGGTLYLEVYSCDIADVTRENEEHSLMKLNEETEELETVYEGAFTGMMHEVGDSLMINRRNGDDYSDQTVLKYDFGTQEWTERYDSLYSPLCNGESFIHREDHEEGYYTYCDIIGENFRINTEVRAMLVAYIGNCVVCSVNTADGSTGGKNVLYVYDLDTMERYIMDVSPYQPYCRVGDGLILRNSTSTDFQCLIPQLGVIGEMFTVPNIDYGIFTQSPYIYTRQCGDNVMILTGKPEVVTNDFGSYTTSAFQYDKLYILSAV